MKHKYKAIRFVDEKQVCELKEEEIKPILYLNDYYNFLDTDAFENAYGHGKGSKDYIYEVLKKHLEALEIIKNKVNLTEANNQNGTKQKCLVMVVLNNDKDFDLLKEVLL